MSCTFPSASALLDSTHGKPRLMVVDDQPQHIAELVHAFAGDYQVLMATSDPQALAVCSSNPPDLVLLDVQMPGMDGFAVCRQLKANPATAAIPVILITTRTDPGTETHGLGLGAVDCIAKPMNPDVVRARVHTHLTLKYQSDLLKKLVLLDGLSGIFNRRYFDQQLATEWARAARSGLSHDGVDGGSISVSVGLGTRVAPHTGEAADLLALASAQLQQAQQEGRGQLRCASLESTPMPL